MLPSTSAPAMRPQTPVTPSESESYSTSLGGVLEGDATSTFLLLEPAGGFLEVGFFLI